MSTTTKSPRFLHLHNYGDWFGPLANRHLQFSETTSTHTTLVIKSEYDKNRATQKDKALSYIPPTTNQDKIHTIIVEVDIQSQGDYWKFYLIDYVIEDTPYLK